MRFEQMRKRAKTCEALALLLALASAASYWLISSLVRGSEPLPLVILYRFGDTDYLSLFYALSRLDFHEFITEGAGHRLVTFPFGLSLFYAVPLKIFGDHGFIVGDLIVAGLRMVACLVAANIVIRNRLGAAAAAVVIFVATGPLPLLSRFSDLFYRPLWDLRNLRPYVTGLAALALVLTTHALISALRTKHRGSPVYVLHGALIGLTVQGDLQLGITAAFVTAAIFAAEWLRGGRDDIRALAGAGLCIAASCAVVALPMMIQVANVDPEVARRLGQIPLSRLAPPVLISIGPWGSLLALALLYGFLAAKGIGNDAGKLGRRLVLVALLFAAMSFLALPLSVVLLGRGIQTYHFPFRAFGFVPLGFVLAGLILAQAGLSRLEQHRLRRWRVPATSAVVLFLAVIHLGFISYRSLAQARLNEQERSWSEGWRAMPGYRDDLEGLWQELARPDYRDCGVLATFDQQLGMLWTTRSGKHVWLPDPFLSSVPDQTIERRLIAFAQLVGMSARDFDAHIGQEYFYNHLLNSMKWHASRYYTFSPLAEYLPEERAKIAERYWSTTMPQDERRRLDALFAEPTPVDGRLDLIVLNRTGDLGGFPGPASGYRRTYENRSFTVWRREALSQ